MSEVLVSRTFDALVLAGPTASGKTACALALADSLPVEIISLDSALVFRHMDIGTAKPTLQERATCPHHLIDVVDPTERYSAARFCEDATRLIAEIRARGNVPLLAGGTMLYLKALHDGLSDLPEADLSLREEIDREAALRGWPALHAELAALDPDAAARLKPNDAQRIQRALEIVRLSGRSLADNYAQRVEQPRPRLFMIGLEPAERSVLHARIADRFEAMLEQGLIDEVRELRERFELNPELPSMRCVGYRQTWDYLDGLYDRAELRDRGIYATRQLAKRQLTWQRKFAEEWPNFVRIDCLRPDLIEAVRAQVLGALSLVSSGPVPPA